MSKRFYIGGAMSMLGMAILVPLILQEPLPAISGESFGPAVSGKLDSTPGMSSRISGKAFGLKLCLRMFRQGKSGGNKPGQCRRFLREKP